MASNYMSVRAALVAAGRDPKEATAAVLAVDCPNCGVAAPHGCRRSDWNECPSRYRAAVRDIEAAASSYTESEKDGE